MITLKASSVRLVTESIGDLRFPYDGDEILVAADFLTYVVRNPHDEGSIIGLKGGGAIESPESVDQIQSKIPTHAP